MDSASLRLCCSFSPHSALSTQHSALSTQHSALSTQHSALSTQHSALSTQHSALSTQHSAPSTQSSVLLIRRLLPLRPCPRIAQLLAAADPLLSRESLEHQLAGAHHPRRIADLRE